MKKSFNMVLISWLSILLSHEVYATSPTKDFPMVGVWKVISYQIIGYPAMNEAQAKNWIGKLVEFSSRKKATLREGMTQLQTCPEFSYDVSMQNAEGYFLVGYKVKPTRLGITQTEVEVVTIRCKEESWLGKSREFVRISDDLILSNWEGVFFFFTKQADSFTLLASQGESKILFVTPQSVGTLTPESDFNEATLTEALSGYTVQKATHLNEDKQEVIDVLMFYRQNQLQLRIFPDPTTRKIARLEIFDEQARAPGGAKVGILYKDLFKDEQVDCEAGIQEYSGQTLCHFKNMESVKYLFEPKPANGGGNLSPIEALNRAKLVGFLWEANPNLMKEIINLDQIGIPAIPIITTPLPAQVVTSPPPVVPPKVESESQVAYKIQDKQLNEVYKRLKEALKIEGESEVEGPVNLTSFVGAQKAWLEFRDKNCAWQTTLKGKNIPSDLWSCLEKMTRERVAELEVILNAIQE